MVRFISDKVDSTVLAQAAVELRRRGHLLVAVHDKVRRAGANAIE